jgi:hypothetical protein
MRLFLASLLLLVLTLAGSAQGTIIERTDRHVRHTQSCERMADRDRAPTPTRRLYARSHSRPFRNWALNLWRWRARKACGKVRYLNSDPRLAVRYVFQRVAQAAKALSVVRCESNFWLWARNGQYENIFQMGLSERRRFGWHVAGSPALVASWAAFGYWRVSGWGPWACA